MLIKQARDLVAGGKQELELAQQRDEGVMIESAGEEHLGQLLALQKAVAAGVKLGAEQGGHR
jgi:hypothetical protein